ncbi:MAG: hypothetical protein AAGU74_01915 [Bacillota bacterium]
MKKALMVLLTLVIAGAALAGCAATDVVLKYSPGSLDAIAAAYPSLITDNTDTDHYYYITVDKETALKVSNDYSLTGDEDIVIETPLQPFLDAGLDVTKLGAGYRADDVTFYLTAGYGDGTGTKDTLTKSVFESVAYDRATLSYHQALDHYGVKLPGGKFEWAKDHNNNDKDIVFAIAAKPLADIGVDVQNVEGWVFKTMQDENGNDIDVLLKPYDLK